VIREELRREVQATGASASAAAGAASRLVQLAVSAADAPAPDANAGQPDRVPCPPPLIASEPQELRPHQRPRGGQAEPPGGKVPCASSARRPPYVCEPAGTRTTYSMLMRHLWRKASEVPWTTIAKTRGLLRVTLQKMLCLRPSPSLLKRQLL
jgi:hypothetical protein